MPSESVPFFDNQLPVSVRLTAVAAAAVGVAPDTDVSVESVRMQDGMVQVVVRVDATHVTRYLVPASSLLYAKQNIVTSAAPGAPGQG